MGVSNYPAALDNFATTSPPNLGDSDSTGRKHDFRHDDMEAAMEAVQGELGTNPSGAAATVAARLSALDTTVSGKANTTHTHAQSDVTGLPAVVTEVNALSVDVATLQSDVAYRVKGYTSSNQPASPVPGDLWVDPDDSSLKIWNGSSFVNPSNAGGGGTAWAVASGGTESTITDGGKSYRLHTFTGNGTFTVTQAGQVEVLMISGGAGAPSGGYLGSGGSVRFGRFDVPAGALPVTVGAGGTSASGTGMLGQPSSLGAVVATGLGTASQGAFDFLAAGSGATAADPSLPVSSTITGSAQTYGLAKQAAPRANRGDGGAANVNGSAGVVIIRRQI